jgi:hypothetical protein
MTEFEQLSLWVVGHSVHDDERGLCCADFSCCRPQLQVDQATRWRYMSAYISACGRPGNEDTIRGQLLVWQMRVMFLERLIRCFAEHLQIE